MGGEDPDLLGPEPPPAPGRTWSGGEHRAALEPRPIAIIPFPRAIEDSFLYPFRSWGAGVSMLVLAFSLDLFRHILRVPVFSFLYVAAIILLGILGSWMFRILEETWSGNEVIPGGPDWTDPAYFAKGAAMAGAAAASAYAPSLAVQHALPEMLPLLGVLNVLGAFWFPMALLLVGVTGSPFAAFRYRYGWACMLRLGRDFLWCAPLFQVSRHLAAAAIYVSWKPGTHWAGLSAAGDHEYSSSGSWHSWVHLSATLIEVYFALVSMRALGLLLRARRTDLGWFRERGEPRT